MIYLTDDLAQAPTHVVPTPVGRSVVRGLVETQPYEASFVHAANAASISFLLNQWMFNGRGIVRQPGDIIITCQILCESEVPSDVTPDDVQFTMYKI